MAKATTKAAAPAKKAGAKKTPDGKTGAKGNSSSAREAPGRDSNSKAPKKGKLDEFLESQLRLLEQERTTYLHQAETLQAEADSLTEDREPGDVQFDEESGEGDTLAVERERDLTLSAQALAAVEEIDVAVVKIHDGTYGYCVSCGKPIPKERLQALPHTTLCVQCKSGGLGLRA